VPKAHQELQLHCSCIGGNADDGTVVLVSALHIHMNMLYVLRLLVRLLNGVLTSGHLPLLLPN